jgi:hypothetical protein
MYLEALDNGFVVLETGVKFLSVDNLPKLVSVSCCMNMFSDEICDSVIGILRNPDSDPDSDSKKIRTREKPGPGLEENPDSCLTKPGLDF